MAPGSGLYRGPPACLQPAACRLGERRPAAGWSYEGCLQPAFPSFAPAAAPGWVPRAFLKGREHRAFLVSFFGLSAVEHGLALPLAHVLTPYPSNGDNTFLGFAMAPRWLARSSSGSSGPVIGPGSPQPPLPLPAKKRQGIVWGKRAEYFIGKLPLLEAVAKEVRRREQDRH